MSPWSCPGVLPRSTFPHGDVLRWVERLIRPCLRKLVGRWVGPNSSANTHSKIILTIPVSARGYQTGDEQGTSLGLSFAHERLRHSHRRKMNCLLFFNCNFLCEWSPPGSAAREPHRKPGGEQLKEHYMKESDTLACNATIKQHQKEILLDTKGQYMKESNTLAGNATIKHHQKEI